MTNPTHACPPLGSERTGCCDSHLIRLPASHSVTSDPSQVTCGGQQEPPDAEARLMRTLRAVRRQCQEWARPSGARTGDSHLRDRPLNLAASVLLELIDHMAPGVSDDDQEQRDLTPTLHDRVATVLVTTVRDGVPTIPGLRFPHGEGGHVFDDDCAMCIGDIDSLATAIIRAVTLAAPPQEARR
ncbi:hypothetical protein [Streptomyces sp. NRRL B-1347]|uniref:hypothetical protein n=1 Tax=Streptomyces sp. NRRL B-1347 TaxID=1476877 RepID=UPI0004C9AF65|nr:hypothetical protein [Streptomyces sp. NRRL B-1347]